MPLLRSIGRGLMMPVQLLVKPIAKPLGYVLRPVGRFLQHPTVAKIRGIGIAGGGLAALGTGIATLNPVMAGMGLLSTFGGGTVLSNAFNPKVDKAEYEALAARLAKNKRLAMLGLPLLGLGGLGAGYYLGRNKSDTEQPS